MASGLTIGETPLPDSVPWPPNAILGRVLSKINIEAIQAMQVNNLGFIASILFVLVPTVFLLILFIQTDKQSQG
ncbi:MAG: photosystem PsbM protein [Cyanobacteriota bacterium]|jgi:photosystem II PsbM protein